MEDIILHSGYEAVIISRKKMEEKMEILKANNLMSKNKTIADIEMHCVICMPVAAKCMACSIVFCRLNSHSHYSNNKCRCGFTYHKCYI